MRATLARLRQCGRCLGKPLGLGLQGLRRAARWIQAGRHRLLNSGLPRRLLTRLQRARRQALGLRLHWLRRRRRRQAMQALGPAARPLPQPGLPDIAAAQALPAAPHRGLVPQAGWAGPARPARAVPAGPVALAMRSGLAASAMRSGLAAGAAGSGLAIGWALCLLVGAPLAWAPLVSDGSLLAMRAAPRLLRDAFAVDLDRAAAALAAPPQAPLAAGPRRLERPAQALPADSGRVEPRLGAETGRSADARAPAAGQGGARLRPAPLRPALRGRSVPRRARYAGR